LESRFFRNPYRNDHRNPLTEKINRPKERKFPEKDNMPFSVVNPEELIDLLPVALFLEDRDGNILEVNTHQTPS